MKKQNSRSKIKTRKKAIAIGVAGSAAFLSGAVSAGPITVTDYVNVGSTHLSQGGASFAGSFDIASLLPASGSFNQPYDVSSARVVAYGYSSVNARRSTSYAGSYSYSSPRTVYRSYTYSYSCGSWWSSRTCYGTSYYAYSVTDYYSRTVRTDRSIDNVRDAMTVDLGSQSASDQVNRYVRTVGPYNYSYSSGSYYSGRRYYSGSNKTIYDHWYGDLAVDQILGASALNDLSLDGLLSYNVLASIGQFRLTGLRLIANVDMNPRASVPEPGSLSLLLLGALLLGARKVRSAVKA